MDFGMFPTYGPTHVSDPDCSEQRRMLASKKKRESHCNTMVLLDRSECHRTTANALIGSHGINRPGATSATAHSRSRAAIDPARPGSGRSQGTAIPAVPGHVPTLARVLCRPAMRPRPPGSSLAEFNGRLNYRAGQATTGNDGVGQRLVRDQGLR